MGYTQFYANFAKLNTFHKFYIRTKQNTFSNTNIDQSYDDTLSRAFRPQFLVTFGLKKKQCYYWYNCLCLLLMYNVHGIVEYTSISLKGVGGRGVTIL